MIYFEYTFKVLFRYLGKIIGLVWFYVAVPFRGYARNTVYNYVLDNNIYLKRLLERPIEIQADKYIIKPYHGTDGGYIKRRKISKIEYYFVLYFIWFWLDDDSNEDTYTKGFNETFLNGERTTFVPLKYLKCETLYGNTFDLGDKRADFPAFCFWAATLWNIRNTFYNQKYLQWEVSEEEWKKGKHFYHRFGNYEFGWVPFDGTDVDKQGRLAFFAR